MLAGVLHYINSNDMRPEALFQCPPGRLLPVSSYTSHVLRHHYARALPLPKVLPHYTGLLRVWTSRPTYNPTRRDSLLDPQLFLP